MNSEQRDYLNYYYELYNGLVYMFFGILQQFFKAFSMYIKEKEFL